MVSYEKQTASQLDYGKASGEASAQIQDGRARRCYKISTVKVGEVQPYPGVQCTLPEGYRIFFMPVDLPPKLVGSGKNSGLNITMQVSPGEDIVLCGSHRV